MPNKSICGFAFAALLSCATPLAAAHLTGLTLFGTTFFGNELIAVDPATGGARSLGPFRATVSPYGIAVRSGRLYTFDPNNDHIRELSAIDGRVLRDVPLTVPDLQGEGDLAFRPSDGLGFLFTALNASAQPVNDLYTFNVDTGAAVRLGSTGVSIDALAFRSDGTLYGLGQGDAKLYTINTSTGAATAVGELGINIGSPIAGMTFAPANGAGVEQLYAALDDRLYIIDTTTGAATPVSSDVLDLGFSSVSGLAFAPGAGVVGNMSSRISVGSGQNVGIGGFIIRGMPDKMVVLRGLGPSLSGLSNTLADPAIELFNEQGVSLASNNDWMSGPDAATIQQLGLAPANSKESALLRSLPEGNYTVVLRSANGGSGIGLVELYDVDSGSGSRLANISSRGLVQSGDNILIGGLIVSGSAAQRIAVRAIGPDLAAAGVVNPLPDPLLDIRDANGVSLATNDNYTSGGQTAELMQNGLTPGDPRDAALIRDFAPGNYTALVRASSGSGVALVEFYNVTGTGAPTATR